jgi:hypothetical protein
VGERRRGGGRAWLKWRVLLVMTDCIACVFLRLSLSILSHALSSPPFYFSFSLPLSPAPLVSPSPSLFSLAFPLSCSALRFYPHHQQQKKQNNEQGLSSVNSKRSTESRSCRRQIFFKVSTQYIIIDKSFQGLGAI